MSHYDWLMLTSGLITSVGGVAWVYVALATYRGQMNAEAFLSCNERYQHIMDSFPRNAWASRLNLTSELPPPSMDLTLSLLSYLNLSSEEFYLFKNRYIDKKVWRLWEAELVRSLRSPLIRREWRVLKSELMYYPDFCTWVERIQAAPELPNAEIAAWASRPRPWVETFHGGGRPLNASS